MARRKKTRPRVEIARAVLRLHGDGPLLPVASLCSEADAAPGTITRWIIHGKHGVYLDGVHCPERGWLSSVAAVRRFRGTLAELERMRAG